MNIKIKSLSLRNFKGAKLVSIVFDDQLTTITGDNRTGKTTIFDAFNWLLFGKNSENKADFSIKPLDEKNKTVSGKGIEHEVSGIFIVDGETISFRRVYKENWVKKRGSNVEVFDGHSEELFIDDVPKKTGEYNSKVNQVFNTEISRMLTNPTYFNEDLKWEQRRSILMNMTGEITEQSIIDKHPELDLIPTIFSEGKTIDDKKKELASKKAKVKESMEGIPARLDELDRSFDPELRPKEVLESTKNHLESKIEECVKLLNNKSAAVSTANTKKSNLLKKKGEIELQIQEERQRLSRERLSEYNASISEKERIILEIGKNENGIELINESNFDYSSKIKSLRSENDSLKTKFENQLAQEFDSEQCICPSCKQSLPEIDIEAQKTAFNNFKASEMNRLKALAVSNNEKIEKYKKSIEVNNLDAETSENKIRVLSAQLEHLKTLIPPVENGDNELIKELRLKVIELQKEINLISMESPEGLNNEIREQKNDYSEKLDAVKSEILKHDNNDRVNSRKVELEAQNKSLVKELGEIEAFEWQIQQFTKIHIESIESSVNSIFQGVKFKMFEQQVNGGEKPTCICLVDGVPYPDVNTAGQINSGLNIIKSLQDHFKTIQPVWIDNRERVSEIIPMNCQIINLKVVSGQKELQVN